MHFLITYKLSFIHQLFIKCLLLIYQMFLQEMAETTSACPANRFITEEAHSSHPSCDQATTQYCQHGCEGKTLEDNRR